MKDLVSKMLNLGLGALAMTKEKVEEVVDELIKQGEISEEESEGLVRELIQRGEKSEAEIKVKIEKILQDILAKLDIPTHNELEGLRAEVNQLKKRVDEK